MGVRKTKVGLHSNGGSKKNGPTKKVIRAAPAKINERKNVDHLAG